MKFTELTVSTTTEAQELVADIMWNYTNYGVAISDVKDVVELINDRKSTWDYIDDAVLKELNDNVTLVKAYVPVDITDETVKKINADLETLKKNCEGNIAVGSLETVKRIVDGDDWIEIWRKHYRPIELGNVLICPAWIKQEPKEGQISVIIDSNMAFGTGEHETTAMCVELLQKYVKPDDVVIDVGCGSGILGITAAKLGAKSVIMTDIDECAIEASVKNCRLNGVTNAQVLLKNLLDDNTVKGDVIVCNIMAEALIAFAPFIGGNLRDGGTIILSGILTDRTDKVVSAYQKVGFVLADKKIRGEWSALAFKNAVSL